MTNQNPPCPKCGGRSYRRDQKRKNRLYSCVDCKKYFTPNGLQPAASNPPCPHCDGHTRKRGQRNGRQQYQCARCKRYLGSSSARTAYPQPTIATPAERARRKRRARRLDEDLLRLIDAEVPKGIFSDVRDDIMQEIALSALSGEFDLPELPQVIPRFRRKVYKQLLTGYRFRSLDAPIPHTSGLTYGDTLAG